MVKLTLYHLIVLPFHVSLAVIYFTVMAIQLMSIYVIELLDVKFKPGQSLGINCIGNYLGQGQQN